MGAFASLTYRDVETALTFLQTAFGFHAEQIVRDDHGEVRSAAVRLDDGVVLVQPDLPDELHGSHLGQGWVYVDVDDPDAHFASARAAGALILSEPHDALNATLRGYSARDPEGNLWSFGAALRRGRRGRAAARSISSRSLASSGPDSNDR